MESEARNQINNNYDKFFYAIMCHVCKQFGDGVQLNRCGGCGMIAYCSQEHQMEHWKHHKPLCEAIQDALQEYDFNDRHKDLEDHDKRKLIFVLLVSRKLGRRLKRFEIEMLIFPRECLVCLEMNDKLLEDCQKCAASFCKNHRDDTEHRNICASLELGLRSDLITAKFNNHLELFPDLKHISNASTCQNMNDFMYALGSTSDSAISNDVLVAERSQYLTRLLTLLYAVRLLNCVLKGNALIIHVVGANDNEVTTLFLWQYLPDLMETTVSSVVVIMIGQTLKDKCDPSRTFDLYSLAESKRLFFAYHDVQYENYVCSPSFVKPDLIVGFNVGNEEHELRSNKETWAPSIHVLGKQNCPVVLTFFTQRDFSEGINKINTILEDKVDYLFSGKNPFASLRPYRFIGPEHVFYHNQYLVIYQSLFVSDVHKESTTKENTKLKTMFYAEVNVACAK